jgi:hypothetical protein
MPSCFNNLNGKAISSPIKSSSEAALKVKNDKMTTNDSLIEKFIIDNPFIFRICCFCVARHRKRVDTAIKQVQQNGNGVNHIHDEDKSNEVLNIDHIGFTHSNIALK